MQPDENPYAAELTDDAVVNQPMMDFGVILRRWERLRIAFNAVLIPWTILLLYFSGGPPGVIVAVPILGLLVNLLYLLGPAIEAYGTWLGYWHVTLSYVLFFCGLIFTAVMAFGLLML